MLFPRRPDEWLRLGWTLASCEASGTWTLPLRENSQVMDTLTSFLGLGKFTVPGRHVFWAFFFWMKMVKSEKGDLTSSDFLVVCEKYLTWNFYETKMLKLVTHRILVVIHGSPEPHRGPRNGLSRSDATGWWRTDPWMAERKQRYGINMEISMGKAI